jgi:tight adherence protein C
VILAFIVAIGLVAIAVTLTLRAITAPSKRSLETVESITPYGFQDAGGAADTGGELERQRPLDSLADSIGGFFGTRFTFLREDELRQRLVAAGMYSTTPRKFIGYQALCSLSLAILWFYLRTAGNVSILTTVLVFIAVIAIGWYLPIGYMSMKTRRRHEEIDYELPELIDLLVVTVEAGVGFVGSLRIAAQHVMGPLGQELRLTLQEQSMGLSTSEALTHMVERADTPGVRMFVRAIVQGETLGVSIGQIMRNLALEMRKRRRAAAEERAQKAPVKMLFPLVFLIFPAMFVVLLLPAMITIVDALK